MPRSSLAHRVTTLGTRLLWSPDDLLHETQATLAALAEIEERYESDRERLEQGAGSDAERHRLRAERDSRRRQERAPCLYRLDELQRRIRTCLTSGL
jgi:hypothetical protein